MGLDSADDYEAFEDEIGTLKAAIRRIGAAAASELGIESADGPLATAIREAQLLLDVTCRPTCTGTFAEGEECEIDCACPCGHGLRESVCDWCTRFIHEEAMQADENGGVVVLWTHDYGSRSCKAVLGQDSEYMAEPSLDQMGEPVARPDPVVIGRVGLDTVAPP